MFHMYDVHMKHLEFEWDKKKEKAKFENMAYLSRKLVPASMTNTPWFFTIQTIQTTKIVSFCLAQATN